MKANRSFIRITRTIAIMSALIMTGTTSVSAADPETVQGETAYFEKYLIMDAETDVPDVTFSFTIEAGPAQEGDDNGSLPVYAGDDAQNVTGTPVIGTAVFTSSDATSQDKSKIPADLASDEKYAVKTVNVDFTNVSFHKPGIYRYVITENDPGRTDIHNDDDNTRILDVWVQYEELGIGQVLKASDYILHNAEADSKVTRNEEPAHKSQGFVNTYVTHDLTLKKTVTGNQGSLEEYFRLTLNISGARPGTVFHVDRTNAKNDGNYTNPETITAREDGTAVQDFWLKDRQSVVIHGLTENVSYSVKEDTDSLVRNGYTASVSITGDTNNSAGPITMDEDTSVSDDAITADTSVEYTNEKGGDVPTGVEVNVFSEVLLCLVGIGGIIGVMWNRMRRDLH